jgi:outer membrane protein assembly factor BamB
VVTASPALQDDGTIIVFAEDNIVHALSPAGTELWRVLIGNESGAGGDYPSPTIRDDGVILVGGKVSRLTAISPNGRVLWTAPARGPTVWSTPAVAADGTAYWSDSDPMGRALRATSADGSSMWSVSVATRLPAGDAGDALIDADGIVYLSAFLGDAVAVDPRDGSVLWRIEGVSGGGGGTIALGIGRRAYVIGASLGDSFRVIEDASCGP